MKQVAPIATGASTQIEKNIRLEFLSIFHFFITVTQKSFHFFSFQRDCPSGQLTRAKFLEVYSGFFPEGNADKFCEHVFRTFDADNSGRIDFKEFLLAINITSAGKPEEKLQWAFQMYDINSDGTIEKSEMVEIISVSQFFSSGKKIQILWFHLVILDSLFLRHFIFFLFIVLFFILLFLSHK